LQRACSDPAGYPSSAELHRLGRRGPPSPWGSVFRS
jgi:hypothetical protein